MEWEQRICPARLCGSGAWMVKHDDHIAEVWSIVHVEDGDRWTVSATDPVCPRCGTTLVTILELEGGLGASGVLEVGPVFDFARSLPL